ncbi:MAG: EAL domain-containing protein [Candidatus Dormibacteria bacterium]
MSRLVAFARGVVAGRFWRLAAWRAYVIMLAGIPAYLILPRGSVGQLIVFMTVLVAATIMVATGRIRCPFRDRWLWSLILLGISLNVLGYIHWYVIPVTHHVQPAFPSLADALYLGADGAWMLSLAILIWRRANGHLRGPTLDAVMMTAGLASLSYSFSIEPTIHASGSSVITLAVAIAYPLIDLFLFGSVVWLVTNRGDRNPVLWLLVLWIGGQFVGDSLFTQATLTGTFRLGDWTMAAWLVSYASLGAAALHPDRANFALPTGQARGLAVRKVLLFGIIALIGPGVALGEALFGNGLDLADIIVLSTLAAVIFILILVRLVGVVRDLGHSEQVSRHLSLHDGLTGLANRVLLVDRTAQAMAALPRSDGAISLLMLDLDGFKKVNDELGHEAGDDLLRHVARSLASSIRPSDTAARLGGDEFCVLLADGDEAAAAIVADRIVADMAAPSDLRESSIPVLGKIGIATFRGGERTVEDLLLEADDAMYAAKAGAANRPAMPAAVRPGSQSPMGKDGAAKGPRVVDYEFFADEMRANRIKRIETEKALRVALERGEFRVVYQPKVSLATDVMSGVEALLRWHHSQRGVIPPLDFIPLAEETGIIAPVGAWVLEQACVQAQRWRDATPDGPAVTVSVNISGRQFESSLVETVKEILSRTGADPTLLCLEVTESAVMSDPEMAIAILRDLRDLGAKISIDDFGTGYSSLAYLKRFPLDELKVDKSFVDDLGRDPSATAIVAAVMGMAHALDVSVVAEGVETVAQLGVLRTLGCDQGQGYYFARPQSASDIDSLLLGGPLGPSSDDGVAAAAMNSPRKSGTVLVVDDAAEVRQLARASLSAAGFDVHEASGGEEAIALAIDLQPDCVVLDLRMPDVGGMEVCRALRANARTTDTTILILSVEVLASGKAAAFMLEADDYIVKPFTPRDLVSRVTAAMRRRREAATPE